MLHYEEFEFILIGFGEHMAANIDDPPHHFDDHQHDKSFR